MSSIISTKPYGGVEQPDFLNGVLLAETLYTPTELLDRLHEIEQEAGRERKIHWGPRTLDLDIIFTAGKSMRMKISSFPMWIWKTGILY